MNSRCRYTNTQRINSTFMDADNKIKNLNPYICSNPVIHKRKPRLPDALAGTLGTKLLAISTFFPPSGEASKIQVNPVETPEAHSKTSVRSVDKLSKDYQRIDSGVELTTMKYSAAALEITGKGITRRRKGNNQVIPQDEPLSARYSDGDTAVNSKLNTNMISSGGVAASCRVKYNDSKQDFGTKRSDDGIKPFGNGKPSSGNLKRATDIQVSVDHGNTKAEVIITDMAVSSSESSFATSNDTMARIDQSNTNRVKGHRNNAPTDEITLQDCTNNEMTETCSSSSPLHGMGNSLTPPRINSSRRLSLAEMILETHAISGRLIPSAASDNNSMDDNSGSEALEELKERLGSAVDIHTGGNEVQCERPDNAAVAKSTHSKAGSVYSIATSLLRKHQPDTTPAEGENSCPIVKRRQKKKKVVMC